MKKILAILLLAAMALSLASCGAKKEEAAAAFAPRLDANTTATLEIAGFMGNFEALDQAMNAFNEYYPNVTFLYDHNSAYLLSDYLAANENVDIFMVNAQNLRREDMADYYAGDWCLDLSKEDVDLSAVQPEALANYTVDGALRALPIAMNPCGVVVNRTLLENNGLSMPTSYAELCSAMDALKDKGYVPLQGSDQHLYGELTLNMLMTMLAGDEGARTALLAGEDSAVDAVLPVFERLEEIIQRGYTDYALNCTYPVDNYDGAIMAFFEGDVPFYVCTSECFSGMKKRESKSEAYSAAPFKYEFVYAPMGDEGAYAYTEPWYGFSVRRDSQKKDLAVEFLRFLATGEQMNRMASIKGMPSAAVDGADERYASLKNAKNLQATFSNDGSVPGAVRDAYLTVCIAFGAGEYATAGEAATAFVHQFAGAAES